MEIKKGEEYEVEIIDNGIDGQGIAKINNFTIFVPQTTKGEKVKILILKVNKNYAFAKTLEILEKSPNRVIEDCKTYKRCGGCSLRHLKYEETLNLKRNIVQNLIDKTLKDSIKVNDVIGMQSPFHYRNKLQYPVGRDNKGNLVMGVFANRTHQIIPVENCLIQNQEAEKVAKSIFDFIKENNISVYDENSRRGAIRHIIVKIGFKTNEIMCILVSNEREIKQERELVNKIVAEFPNVKTIVKNINSQNTNVILGKENIILYGDGFIQDKLENFTFKISPMSFYQTNPIQTEVLYNKAIEFAKLDKEDILCDLYCGIGTIGIFASDKVKKVYGIEIVPEAVETAKENAKINNVDNIEFIVGDVEKAFKELIEVKGIHPTAIIVDPPRRGLDATTINKILNLEVNKFVYVSCNPATMVRDLKILEEKYQVKEIQPVDMFPYTNSVECVSVLQLK